MSFSQQIQNLIIDLDKRHHLAAQAAHGILERHRPGLLQSM
jgi:hypothetical protein